MIVHVGDDVTAEKNLVRGLLDGFFEIRHELNWIIVLTIYYTTDKFFCYLQKIFQSKEHAMLQFFSKTV